jgi:hypothetical protein
MRRLVIVILALLLMVGVTVPVALADNPHFVNASATFDKNTGNLLVSFKIAGLGTNVTTTVMTSGDATAEYACQNRGGNFPTDPKKQTVNGPVSASGEFTSGKNGSINGSLLLTPPPTTLTCPGNQRVVLASVTYTNVQISEPNAGTVVLGTFSRVFFVI